MAIEAIKGKKTINEIASIYEVHPSQVRLMIRIAEKLGFMKVRAVMVCPKVGIGRKVGV